MSNATVLPGGFPLLEGSSNLFNQLKQVVIRAKSSGTRWHVSCSLSCQGVSGYADHDHHLPAVSHYA